MIVAFLIVFHTIEERSISVAFLIVFHTIEERSVVLHSIVCGSSYN